MVQSVDAIVGSVRNEDSLPVLRSHIASIVNVADNVLNAVMASSEDTSSYQVALKDRAIPMAHNLADCREKLMDASDVSQGLDTTASAKELVNRLPPLAFQMARQTKEIAQQIEGLQAGAGKDEDFS